MIDSFGVVAIDELYSEIACTHMHIHTHLHTHTSHIYITRMHAHTHMGTRIHTKGANLD